MTGKKHIWIIFLALLLLAGCARYTDTPPGLQGPGSTADPDTPASEDGDSTAPSDSSTDLPVGPRLPYVAAEFGAPVTRNGRFPIDEETSDAIQALVNLDGEMRPAAVPSRRRRCSPAFGCEMWMAGISI